MKVPLGAQDVTNYVINKVWGRHNDSTLQRYYGIVENWIWPEIF